LKAFKDYILHSEMFSYVPNNAIKEILTHDDSEGRREKWIAKMEYDMEIKPTKPIKGQGMEKLMD
jgi:hypothetical protein